jgi:hypothetical protein
MLYNIFGFITKATKDNIYNKPQDEGGRETVPPFPPTGFSYITDNNNLYLIDNDGAFIDAPT